jgi:hypothetical protein
MRAVRPARGAARRGRENVDLAATARSRSTLSMPWMLNVDLDAAARPLPF